MLFPDKTLVFCKSFFCLSHAGSRHGICNKLYTYMSFRYDMLPPIKCILTATKIPRTGNTESLNVCRLQHKYPKIKKKTRTKYIFYMITRLFHVSHVICPLFDQKSPSLSVQELWGVDRHPSHAIFRLNWPRGRFSEIGF